MSWSSWLRAWDAHSRLQSFQRKVDAAIAAVHATSPALKWFCALSGGKDGCALAGILSEAGRNHVPCVHVHTDLNTPSMEDTAKQTADLLGMPFTSIEPDIDGSALDYVRRMPPGNITEPPLMDELLRKIASGNMLVAYTYEQELDGSYTGMRAEESKGRRMNRRIRGKQYQLASDGKFISQPIVDWKSRDVFAYLVSRGIPIHPHYSLLLDRFAISPESQMSRVDCMITSDAVSARGAIAHVPVLYPELWRALSGARPELRRFI